jgi:hypothetical protein
MRNEKSVIEEEEEVELAKFADKGKKHADRTAIVVTMSKVRKSLVSENEDVVKENVKLNPQQPLKELQPVKEPEGQPLEDKQKVPLKELEEPLKDPPLKDPPLKDPAPQKLQHADLRINNARTPQNVVKIWYAKESLDLDH